MDPHCVDINQSNGLILACWNNTNLEIIKFLLELFKGKENDVDRWGENCFLSACTRNQNLDVIEFLINDLNMSVDHRNIYGNNCLLLACMEGNLRVVKFLINDVKMSTVHGSIDYKNMYGENCIVVANKCNDIEKRLRTIEYLINETSICIDVRNMKLNTFKYVLPGICDSKRLNVLVRLMIKKSPLLAKDVNLILNDLNPFLLDSQNRKDAMIDVFEKQYQEIKNLVDSMDQRIESDTMNQSFVSVSETNSKSNSNSNKRSNVAFDFSKQSEFLFTHGSKNYHGQRKIVYESILLLKDVCCECDDNFFDLIDQELVLEGNLPEKIINQYIASAYTGFFDTQCVEESEDHFIDFLKFIDQYPMTNVSIDKLEHWIIGFIETHSMNLSRPDIEYLKLVSDRYMMKRLYIVLHNLAYL
jgi:ankyrin repeat protein